LFDTHEQVLNRKSRLDVQNQTAQDFETSTLVGPGFEANIRVTADKSELKSQIALASD